MRLPSYLAANRDRLESEVFVANPAATGNAIFRRLRLRGGPGGVGAGPAKGRRCAGLGQAVFWCWRWVRR